jgi:hypothetical protein
MCLFCAVYSYQMVAVHAAASPPLPQYADHVIVIGIDGLASRCLALASTPTLNDWAARGAFSNDARAYFTTDSKANWASIEFGSAPSVHGVYSNQWVGSSECPAFPSVFSAVRDAGRSTTIVASHGVVLGFLDPNPADIVHNFHATLLNSGDVDMETLDDLINEIENRFAAFTFVNLDSVDAAGHSNEWCSPQQLSAIERIDARLAEVETAAATMSSTSGSFAILVTSDHGGRGRSHSDLFEPDGVQIPWLAVGSGVLQQPITRTLMNSDIAPTALALLGIHQPLDWSGNPYTVWLPRVDGGLARIPVNECRWGGHPNMPFVHPFIYSMLAGVGLFFLVICLVTALCFACVKLLCGFRHKGKYEAGHGETVYQLPPDQNQLPVRRTLFRGVRGGPPPPAIPAPGRVIVRDSDTNQWDPRAQLSVAGWF